MRQRTTFLSLHQLAIETLRSDNYLIVNKLLVKQLGPLPAILLSIYMNRYVECRQRGELQEEWFHTHHQSLQETLNIGVDAYRTAKQTLEDEGIISYDKRGMPAREFVRINFAQLFHIISKGITPPKPVTQAPVKVRAEERSVRYLPIAQYLSSIIQSYKNITHTSRQITAWAKSIRQLVEEQNVDPSRIKHALKWYKRHANDPYVPVIESGKSLKEKFIKLESAIKREQTPTKDTSHPPIIDDGVQYDYNPVTGKYHHCRTGKTYIP